MCFASQSDQTYVSPAIQIDETYVSPANQIKQIKHMFSPSIRTSQNLVHDWLCIIFISLLVFVTPGRLYVQPSFWFYHICWLET